MKVAIVQFPGSNCDQDCVRAFSDALGMPTRIAWHKETRIDPDEMVVLPGGFSYGDYLRCGAIARFSPIMKAVMQAAKGGQTVLGICNGFQILCECGLLPGALVRNRDLHFICESLPIRVDNAQTRLTNRMRAGQILRIPIAHGEGNYRASPEMIETMNDHGQILFRYCAPDGTATEAANPNGSIENIAGICNERGNVFGMMPHPERACDPLLGGRDGLALLESIACAQR
jgi:phosphoribosylformylglycinamidine synthase